MHNISITHNIYPVICTWLSLLSTSLVALLVFITIYFNACTRISDKAKYGLMLRDNVLCGKAICFTYIILKFLNWLCLVNYGIKGIPLLLLTNKN